MSGIAGTINKLLDNAEQMLKRGAYRQAYICTRNVLGIVKTTDPAPELSLKVLVASAKSAYYFSRFEEAENYLKRAESFIKINELDCGNSVHREIILTWSNILRRRGDYGKALEYIEKCSQECGDSEFAVRRSMIAGICHMELGEADKGRRMLETALGLATHSEDERGRSSVLSSLGLLSMKAGYLTNAADYFKRALRISTRTGDVYNRAAAGLNHAIACYRLGRFAEAKAGAEEALASFKECEWKPGICRCYLALGNIERYRGELKSAKTLYRRADSIAVDSSLSREKALADGYCAQVYLEKEELAEAENCCRSALNTILEVNPHSDVTPEQYRVLGRIMMKRGNFAKAEEYLNKGMEMAAGIKAAGEEGLIYWRMAELSFLSRDLSGGRKLFKKAVKTLRVTGSDLDLSRVKLSFAENLFRFSINRDNPSTVREREAIDTLWYLLIETMHLAGGVEIDSLRKRTSTLLEKVYRIREKLPRAEDEAVAGKRYIEVGFSSEFILHEGIVAVSGLMRNVLRDIEMAASHEGPVLVTGETGTGKELVARAVHSLGNRAGGRFVAVNCSAIPYRLFESEFFGHRKGSFSGAATDRRGLFEEASGGTLFLDEIGELEPAQQAKLLRILQEGKVRRVGENIERDIDVRLISATNRNLEKRIEEGSMRQDFYFRINEEVIGVPPLRERREDIVPLIAFCLCGNGNGDRVRIEKNALKFLRRYPWPGNVREFISVLKRVNRISRNGIIRVDALPERVRGSVAKPGKKRMIAGRGREEKKMTLLKLLKSCNGNKTEVARWLGISRGTLYKELKQAGLGHLIG